MNRLTKRNSNGVAYMSIAETLAKWEQEIEGSQAILEGVYAIFQKLAAYEDTGLEPEEISKLIKEYNKDSTIAAHYEQLEEQSLLIKLPCNVRDRVFSNHNLHSTKGDKVTQIKINRGGLHFKTWWGYFRISDIGKTIFLTKEEAEKALEERK